MNTRVDVAVVGAGLSGLAAALGAQRAGASVVVLESNDHVGGVVATSEVDGYVFEHAPNSFTISESVQSLLQDVGLDGEVIAASEHMKRRYIVRNGKLVALPTSPPAFLSSSAVSLAGKLRVMGELLIPKNRYDDEESIAALVRRRLGHEVLDYFVDPFVSGVYAGNPEHLSSRYAFKMLSELEHEHRSLILGSIRKARKARKGAAPKAPSHSVSLRHGLAQLPHAMAGALKVAPMLQTRVTRVSRDDGLWAVTATSSAGDVTVRASSLVVSAPTWAIDSIDWPDSMQHDLAVLSDVHYAPVATVALGFPRAAVQHPLDGFGVLIPSAEKRRALGVLFNSSTFAGRAPDGHVLMTAFFGGARMHALPPDAEILAAVVGDVQSLLGITSQPDLARVTRWERGIPQFNMGHERVINAATNIEYANRGLVLTGSWRHGVSVSDCLTNGCAAARKAVATLVREFST